MRSCECRPIVLLVALLCWAQLAVAQTAMKTVLVLYDGGREFSSVALLDRWRWRDPAHPADRARGSHHPPDDIRWRRRHLPSHSGGSKSLSVEGFTTG